MLSSRDHYRNCVKVEVKREHQKYIIQEEISEAILKGTVSRQISLERFKKNRCHVEIIRNTHLSGKDNEELREIALMLRSVNILREKQLSDREQ